jgi:type VI secretion system protein ImpM
MRDDRDLIGLFGKTRSQRDFVRVNIGAPAAQELDAWLRDSVMTLPSLRAHLPVDPLLFVFRAPSGACLIGVLRGSADGVGREFPLAVFAPLDTRAHVQHWSALPLAYAGFIQAAAGLLDEVDGLDPAKLPVRLASLPVPDADAIATTAAQGRAALARISADELFDRLFARPTGNPEGERWVDDHLHGLGMLIRACERVVGGPPQAGAITLDCPVSSELELLFWLELSRRLIGWDGPPSLLWAPQQHRMLLALGSPGPSLLGVLGTPGTFDRAIWPVVADDEQTAARGGQLLSADQRAAIERVGQSGAELLDILAPDGRR